jgi:F-type H+-transporting ATPase subunit a
MKLASLALLLLGLAAPVRAQDHPQPAQTPPAATHAPTAQENAASAVEQAGPGGAANADIIMPHITDGHHMEVPWPNSHFAKEVTLPQWEPIHIGGMSIDLSPTKHVVMLFIAALICATVLILGARSQRRHIAAGRAPKGVSNGVEAIVLYIRNEVIIPNVGPNGNAFVPFVLTLFFFILFANMLGLVPYGSTPTGNIAVTATLAVMSFLVIEVAGMRALGKGYLGTIVYWPHDMSLPMKMGLTLVMTPVELIGKFTKPFALAIRLFANMTAGHVVVLAFIGMIFTFQSWLVAPLPFVMAVGIMLLEILVGFIQAFIFTLLVSVFIGQIRTAHH